MGARIIDRRGGVLFEDLKRHMGIERAALRKLMAECGISVAREQPMTMAQAELLIKRQWFNRTRKKWWG